jgi:hypothetical protein
VVGGPEAEWLDGPGAADGLEEVETGAGGRGAVAGGTLEVGGRLMVPGTEGADVGFGEVDGAVGEPVDRWLAGEVAAVPQAAAAMATAPRAKTHDLRIDELLNDCLS